MAQDAQSAPPSRRSDEKPDQASQQASIAQDEKKDIEAAQNGSQAITYPPIRVVLPIILALYLGLFTVALDRTILATAIPIITDEFHSLGDVGWYGSSYMLTGCTTQLVVGRLYTFYNQKVVYLSSLFLFEAGSAICGAAPNSIAFIIGRAIAGLGSGGVFTGGILLIIPLVPLHKRPVINSMAGALFGIASVVGPLMGGAFTQHVTWRWCFYINLPVGAIAAVVVFFVLKETAPPKNAGLGLKEKMLQLDPLGNALFVPGMVCLLLALQWGGSTYHWGNARIIALLILGFLLLIVWWAVQVINRNDTATVPTRIVKQRTVASALWFTFCAAAAMMGYVYYLPIWFQAIKGASAVKSGLMLLPIVLSLVVAGIMTGILVQRFGYYTPFMIASSVLASIGAGLLTTLTTTSGKSYWIGYQVLFGFGLGLGMQQGNIAIQCTLPHADIPVGTTLLFFMQQLGGAVFVSVCQNVFTNELVKGIRRYAPNVSPKMVVGTGATDLRNVVSKDSLQQVLTAYNGALMKAFTVGLAMVCLGIFGSVFIEWKNVKKVREEQEAKNKGPAEPQQQQGQAVKSLQKEEEKTMDASEKKDIEP